MGQTGDRLDGVVSISCIVRRLRTVFRTAHRRIYSLSIYRDVFFFTLEVYMLTSKNRAKFCLKGKICALKKYLEIIQFHSLQ